MGTRAWSVAATVLAASLACGGDPTAPTAAGEGPSEPRRVVPRGRAVALRSVVATSGTGAGAAVDGDPATAWQPARDPTLEGVLLRFTEPVALGRVEVSGCPEAERVELVLDGVPALSGPLPLSYTSPDAAPVSAVFVEVAEGRKGACLHEIALTDGGGEVLALEAPRSWKGTVRATSTLAPVVAWRPAYLFDGRPELGWIDGLANDDGLGEKVTVRFEEPRQLTGVEIWNGDQRSPDDFAKRNRVKKLRLSSDGRGSREILLADAQGAQLVPIEPPMNGREIVVEIAEVYAASGSDGDTALSEIRFHDRGGPFALDLPDLLAAGEQLRSAVAGTPLSRVVGLGYHGRCGAGELKLRADSSFVWSGRVPGGKGKEPADEVIDGTWTYEDPGAPWSKLTLSGRRVRVGADPTAKDAVRPLAGKLLLATPESVGAPAFVKEVEAMARGPAKDKVLCVLEEPDGMEALLKSGPLLVKGADLDDLMIRRAPAEE